MSPAIESLSALTLDDPADVMPASQATPAFTIDFGKLITSEVGSLNESTLAAERAMRDLSEGRPVELHEVMVTLEKARLGVQTFVQVRNKLVEAYQDLMRMQM
jgi:flagellar hook-basal body complex protein FliE